MSIENENNPTIVDVVKLKADIEEQIKLLLARFEKISRMEVHGVDLERFTHSIRMGESESDYKIVLDVRMRHTL